MHVTARFPHGVVTTDQFPIPLDGVLAAAARRDRLAGSYGRLVDHHVQPLPLALLPLKGPWVWAATCAAFPGIAGTDIRWWHQRFDTVPAERVVDALPASTDTGRFKPWRSPTVVTLADRAEWWACGDPDGIRDILTGVSQVGRRRGQGEGVVTGWEVVDHGPPDRDRIVWTTAGFPARPLPQAAARTLNLCAVDTIGWTYRPPYWRPTFDGHTASRPLRPVIAPWVVAPADAAA